jgi:pyruvate/2-oxoglutarate dehydrogenase complex dihydrolipoamide acyltransferase (E2) component
MSITIKVPPLPRGLVFVTVGHWYKSVGDVVGRHETLVELITSWGDLIQVTAHQAGIVEKIFFLTGAVVEANAILAILRIGLPNLVWDAEQEILILESYQVHDKGMTAATDLRVREELRKVTGKLGQGFGSPLAVQPDTSTPGAGNAALGERQAYRFKPHPKLNSSQFSGVEKNPDGMRVPSNEAARRSPQMAPNLAPKPQPGISPTPKFSPG